jgi:hypothetical protein
MKRPTHQTQKEEPQWRTTVRLAVVVASLLVLLVVALVGATLELGRDTPQLPSCGDKHCRAVSAHVRWANFPWTSSGSSARAADRVEAHRRDGLITRCGPYAALTDVLMALASCERRRDFSQSCGARFTDLARRRTPP